MSVHQVRGLRSSNCTLRGISSRHLMWQPRSYIWAKFDSLLVLGKRGQVQYCGRRDGVEEFFAQYGFECPADYNPADFVLDTVSNLDAHMAATLEQATGYGHTPAAIILSQQSSPPVLCCRRCAAHVNAGHKPFDHLDTFAGPRPQVAASRRGSTASELVDVTGSAVRLRACVVARRLGVVLVAVHVAVCSNTSRWRAQTPNTASSHADVLRVYARHQAGFRRSLWELSLRTLVNVLRNPYLLLLNYTAVVVIGLLTRLVFTHLPFVRCLLRECAAVCVCAHEYRRLAGVPDIRWAARPTGRVFLLLSVLRNDQPQFSRYLYVLLRCVCNKPSRPDSSTVAQGKKSAWYSCENAPHAHTPPGRTSWPRWPATSCLYVCYHRSFSAPSPTGMLACTMILQGSSFSPLW